ncbi:MAG: sigma-70 family RNA polymerase sigma factor [Ruminococcaceae bacterium]|nr:sigma-70 family RNA polymerase sigma factor [Oscillospiraceae bacterium]
MKGRDAMTPEHLTAYYDRLYGYAVRHTFTEEEAADLTQEILYTVLKQLPTLKNEDAAQGWMWGIAANVTRAFRRRMGKQRAMFVYDMPDTLSYEDEYPVEDEELYASLRGCVAGLSRRYRDIVILHYYDGLSTKEIADRLDIPEGTVTWRLSEARRKLKGELENMEITALKPKCMRLDIYGTGDYSDTGKPFPHIYISDALSQNILIACYDEALSVEALSKHCGVPAYYIEDSIANLLRRQALTEQGNGKYRTDFLIWDDRYDIYCETHAEEALMPVMEPMLDALDTIAEEAMTLDFYRAGKPKEALYGLFSVLAFSRLSMTRSHLPYPEFCEKYDGCRWCYIGNMESGAHHRVGIGEQKCCNQGSRGNYSHTVYAIGNGYTWREMMIDYEVNVCEDLLTRGDTDDGYSAAEAVRRGYIDRMENGTFFVKTPAFTLSQKAAFDQIADRHLHPLAEAYRHCLDAFLTGYRALFPSHLAEDTDRMCASMYVGMITVILAYGMKSGRITPPPQDTVCDVLIQFK